MISKYFQVALLSLSDHNYVVVEHQTCAIFQLPFLFVKFCLHFLVFLVQTRRQCSSKHRTLSHPKLVLCFEDPLSFGVFGVNFDQISPKNTIKPISEQIILPVGFQLSQTAAKLVFHLKFIFFHFVDNSAHFLGFPHLADSRLQILLPSSFLFAFLLRFGELCSFLRVLFDDQI